MPVWLQELCDCVPPFNSTDDTKTPVSVQALSSMLEGSEAMSDCMAAELQAFVELQQLMLMVS